MGFLNRYSEPIFLVLRVVAGLIFAMHGAQKLFGAYISRISTPFLSKIWISRWEGRSLVRKRASFTRLSICGVGDSVTS